jgi:PAS domain S-box-containing protein
MPKSESKQKSWFARHRYSPLVQYGGAAIAVWLALSLWAIFPLAQRHPVTLYLAAVLFTARFLGFRSALLCALLSAVCIDFFAFPPLLSLRLDSSYDMERLLVFLGISIFAGSMARQKTLAESRAERTTREMAAIVESSRDAMVTTDSEGRITSWNRAAERLYGYTPEEAVGMLVTALAPPELRDEALRNRDILAAGETVEPYRTERIRKDGTRWPVLLSISPLVDASGALVGSSAIARDLSAEKQSEEAVRRTEKLATAGRLAASIAHEINYPLEAILYLLYLARSNANLSVD